MEESFSNDSAIIKRQTNVMLTECRICAAPALYSYFGVISCHACKMFFKRNAEQRQKTLKCISNGNCDINLAKRHVCSYCRLVKCFKTGMQIKMIRSSQPKTNRKRRLISGRSTQTTERALIPSNQLGQISTLSLLQCDSSRLTIEQWNLLSNISHCYDEYNGFSKCERFMFDQNVLPIKLRFKCSSMIKLIQICVGESQLVYKHNVDFLSLSSNDRSILLENTFSHIGSLLANFVIHKVGLMDLPVYYDAIANISHPNIIPAAQRVAKNLNFDIIIMKLFLAILSFSTINYTDYSKTSPKNLSNIKQILHIQDQYVELTWKYLVYKSNAKWAVKTFSDFVRCIFSIHNAVVKTKEIQWLAQTYESLVDQTKQSLVLND